MWAIRGSHERARGASAANRGASWRLAIWTTGFTLAVACAPGHPDRRTGDATATRLRAAAARTGWHTERFTGVLGEGTTWCSAVDAQSGCVTREAPGTGWRTLEAATAGSTSDGRTPQLSWQAAGFPAVDGWGGKLDVSLGSEADWTLDVVRYAGGAETDRFAVGRSLHLTVEITDIDLPPPADAADALAQLAALRSPTTGAGSACDALVRLAAGADAALARGEVRRCHYGTYTGDNSIECRPVPLPASEIPAWRDALARDRERRCDALRSDPADFAALLADLWPIPPGG